MNILYNHEGSEILCLSSLLFLIPIIYAFENNLYLYSLFLSGILVTSFNFWRHPIYGIRRNMDLYYAKISFIISCIIYYIYCNNYESIFLTIFILSSILYNYYLSSYYYEKLDNKWIFHHACFHASLVLQQCIILYDIIHCKKN